MFSLIAIMSMWIFLKPAQNGPHARVRENVEWVSKLIKIHLSHLPFSILPNIWLSQFPT